MPHPPRSQPHPDLLRISEPISTRSRHLLTRTWTGLPLNPSGPVQIAFLPRLTVTDRKLLSGADHGTPVYAANFIRERRIVLESELLRTHEVLRFIFVHELFHFAWTRLGNRLRDEYRCLLANEITRKVRGELGESSAVKKSELGTPADFSINSPLWRDYACESFCDSAASFFTAGPVHKGYKLGKAWTTIRLDWFQGKSGNGGRWRV